MNDEIAELISQNTDPQQIFELLDLLGQGSYGSVSKALHKLTGQLYAIKILPATSGVEIASIKKQISVLKDCNDDHIVKYYGSYYKDNHLWIVMEYCIAGSVADIMLITKKKFNEFEIASILQSALKGLDYIHSKKKIHRDIKAGNILLDQKGNAKLADFGVSASAVHTNARFRTHIGSPFWMSPQILRYSQYDYKTDIWSLGITAIQLAEGQAPNSHMKPFMAIFVIKSNPVQGFKQPSLWSPQLNDFVKQCLQISPTNRPEAKELLQHPFIKKFSKGQRLLSQLVLSSMEQIQQYRMNQSVNSSFAQIIVDNAREETKTVVNRDENNQKQIGSQSSDSLQQQLESSMIIVQSHRSQSQSETGSVVIADCSMIQHDQNEDQNQPQKKIVKNSSNPLANYINQMRQRQQILPLKCAEALLKNLNSYDHQFMEIINKLFAQYKNKVQSDIKSLEELKQKNNKLNINISYNCRIKQCQNLRQFICPQRFIQKINSLKDCKQNYAAPVLLINSRQKFQEDSLPNSKIIIAKHNQSTQQRQTQKTQKTIDERKQAKSFLIPNSSINSQLSTQMIKPKKIFNSTSNNEHSNQTESGGKLSQFQATVQKNVPNSHNSSRIVLKGAIQFQAVTQSQINQFKQPQIMQYLQKKYLNPRNEPIAQHTQSNCNYPYSSNKMISKTFERLTSTEQSKSKNKNKANKQVRQIRQIRQIKDFKGKKDKRRGS